MTRASAPRPRPTVLLAEDDDFARDALATALRGLGCDVDTVSDGGRFLVRLAAQYKDGRSPKDLDLIVSDIMMPVCTGLEIFEGLRAAHWRTPVILMTAFDTPKARLSAHKLGATLLIKPFDLETFEKAVLDRLGPRAAAVATGTA